VKSSELKALSLQELQEKLDHTRRSLYELRVRSTVKELENTSDIRRERRNIARIKQALADKQRQPKA
jgi:large subunit ribosomal protein L29